ncbi:hypothetical protein IP88_00925 [alpha proteobacterium AAP81b]|nr:hypothetical protein IP88_00925 [alpha proteobacterium AAP81b]
MIEVFSILLPGALLVAALLIVFGLPPAFATFLAAPGSAWIAFGLAAYAAGHIVFYLAASLDDRFYDRYRKKKWPPIRDRAYIAASALRFDALPPPNPWAFDDPMNTFAWAKAALMFRAPAAYADVLRYEADSKFFRSLVVVLPIVGLLLFRGMVLALPILSCLGYACFFRYAERRYKSTEWAYRYVIVLGTVKPAAAPSKDPEPDAD